jgi:curved DNA-binding protein CbpA
LYLTCCKILGIKPGADAETIKAAYRKSAMELHPDHNPSPKAHDYFIILQNAYEYLIEHPYVPLNDKVYSPDNRRRESSFSNSSARPASFRQVYHIQRYTLREVLNKSLMARVLYVGFHILFLIIGFFLIIRSVIDIIFYSVDERTDPFSAYISVGFAIFFGLVISSVFLYTGYSFIKER